MLGILLFTIIGTAVAMVTEEVTDSGSNYDTTEPPPLFNNNILPEIRHRFAGMEQVSYELTFLHIFNIQIP